MGVGTGRIARVAVAQRRGAGFPRPARAGQDAVPVQPVAQLGARRCRRRDGLRAAPWSDGVAPRAARSRARARGRCRSGLVSPPAGVHGAGHAEERRRADRPDRRRQRAPSGRACRTDRPAPPPAPRRCRAAGWRRAAARRGAARPPGRRPAPPGGACCRRGFKAQRIDHQHLRRLAGHRDGGPAVTAHKGRRLADRSRSA